jgi:hypothetical protein
MPNVYKPHAVPHQKSCPLSPLQRQAHPWCNRSSLSNSESRVGRPCLPVNDPAPPFLKLSAIGSTSCRCTHHRLRVDKRLLFRADFVFCSFCNRFVSSVSPKPAPPVPAARRIGPKMKNPDAPAGANDAEDCRCNFGRCVPIQRKLWMIQPQGYAVA